ncbi:MAG: dockerin type I repeat-containing protein [bacterium]|nr:dockerin type I repeat-containing protein [bacterium]
MNDEQEDHKFTLKSINLGILASLIILISIPITVFAVYGVRSLTPQAATGKPSSLTPAYSTYSTTPTFSWNCYCYTTKYRVYLRAYNGNFYSGSWYKDVYGSSGVNSTNFGGWSSASYGTPPSQLTVGTTYYWTVSCVTGGCTTASTQAFTVLSKDTTPPVLTVNATNITTNSITWKWSATDNVGISGYYVCTSSSDLVDPKYYEDYNPPNGPTGGGSSGICSPLSLETTQTWSNLRDSSKYQIRVGVDDTSNNNTSVTKEARTLKKDSDGDSFGDAAESHMGTSPTAACGSSAWPIDFNSDKKVTSADQLLLAKYIGADYKGTKSSSGNYYRKRYDLNLDGYINSTDQGFVTAAHGKTCT